jgi:hypothetical protein
MGSERAVRVSSFSVATGGIRDENRGSGLAKITSRLEFLKHIIKAKDQDEAREFFRRLRENMREED